MKQSKKILSLFLWSFCVLLCLSIGAFGKASSYPSEKTIRESWEKTVRSHDIQTKLPNDASAQLQEVSPLLNKMDWIPFKSLETLAKILFWAGIAALIVVVLGILWGSLGLKDKTRKLTLEDKAAIAPVATAQRMEKAQIEADELARRGDFVEAIHVLLLQCLEEMRRRLGISIAASLTSREILDAITLSPPAKRAFADIISEVEISYFGNYIPSEEDYRTCRKNYETLSADLQHKGDSR